MMKSTNARAAALLLAGTVLAIGPALSESGARPRAGRTPHAAAVGVVAPANPCVFPTAMSATPEETAWRLFVAANCPANSGKVVWENWVEQLQFYPANASGVAANVVGVRRLHGSPLARVLARQAGEALPNLAPNTECSKMRGPPPGLAATVICEEARLNPQAAAFITHAGYQVRTAQMKAAKNNVDIQFTTPSVEVKVDWVPATDFKPAFTCANPPAGVRVEMIAGACYAMLGIHIESKLLKDWVWATFEPQSVVTNPGRCITFGDCHDSWGATPATSSGGPGGVTKLTPPLKALMLQARLAPSLQNYRLDGVQTEFGTAAAPTLLGNSIIEGENVGMKAGAVSCISCHSQSAVKSDGTDQLPNLAATVGVRFAPPPGWIARDFVWSLAFACPDPTQTGGQNCQTAPARH